MVTTFVPLIMLLSSQPYRLDAKPTIAYAVINRQEISIIRADHHVEKAGLIAELQEGDMVEVPNGADATIVQINQYGKTNDLLLPTSKQNPIRKHTVSKKNAKPGCLTEAEFNNRLKVDKERKYSLVKSSVLIEGHQYFTMKVFGYVDDRPGPALLQLYGRDVCRLSVAAAGQQPLQRADRYRGNFENIINVQTGTAYGENDLKYVHTLDSTHIVIDKFILMTVTNKDARQAKTSTADLGKRWGVNIKAVLRDIKDEDLGHSPKDR